MLRPYEGGRLNSRIRLREGGVEEIVYSGAVFGGDGKDGDTEGVEGGGACFLLG